MLFQYAIALVVVIGVVVVQGSLTRGSQSSFAASHPLLFFILAPVPAQTVSQTITTSQLATSLTLSQSDSRSVSQSISATRSQSASQSQSLSRSQSQSASRSQALTQSQSLSRSQSQSASRSQALTPTQSASQTQSVSESTTQSQSISQTPSQLASQTSSQQPSVTATPSQTHTTFPAFCDNVVGDTCVVSSRKVGTNCSGQGSIFNVTDDLEPQDFDACTVFFAGNLHLLPNSSLTCALPEVCLLSIDVSGNVTIDAGSFISANTVTINASVLIISFGASISASDLGFLYGPGAGTVVSPGSGGSHGGSGGRLPCLEGSSTRNTGQASYHNQSGSIFPPTTGPLLRVGFNEEVCCNGEVYFSNVNQSIGSWADPLWTGSAAAGMGSGGGCPGAGNGGGRVKLTMQILVVNGDVSADGGLPNSSGGSGSGGSIVIIVNSVSGSGKIHANGGAASLSDASWAAGGGGRIAVTYATNSMAATAIAARGGVYTGDPSLSACLNGAAGTVVFNSLTGDVDMPFFREIKVANLNAALAVTLLTVSSLDNDLAYRLTKDNLNPDLTENVDTVLLQNDAVVATQGLILRYDFKGVSYRRRQNLRVGSGLGFTPLYVGFLMASRSSLLPFAVAEVGGGPFVGPEDDSRFPPRAPTLPNVTISAAEIELSSSYISTDDTAMFLSCDNMTLGPGSTLAFDGLFTIRANNTIYMDGQALTRKMFGLPRHLRGLAIGGLVTSELQIWAGVKVFIDPNCDFVADIMGIYCANNITVSGRIENNLAASKMDHLCSLPISRRETCAETAWLGTTTEMPPINNYTLVISSGLFSGYLLIDNNGLVEGNIAQVCGLDVQIQSFVSTNTKGCGTDVGPGSGQYVVAAGSGGGHGGAGGVSFTGDAGGLQYDSATFPLYPGSGGGSDVEEAASAGGYVMIEATLQFEVDSSIVSADGTEPSAPAGGGAGGAIVILTSQLTGDGIFTANGGEGYKGGGGGGGGIITLQRSPSATFVARAVEELASLATLFMGNESLVALDRRLSPMLTKLTPRLSIRDPLPWLVALFCNSLNRSSSFQCFINSTFTAMTHLSLMWAERAASFCDLLDALGVANAVEVPKSTLRSAVLAHARKKAADARWLLGKCAVASADIFSLAQWKQTAAFGFVPAWLMDCATSMSSCNSVDLRVPSSDNTEEAVSVRAADELSHWRILWAIVMPLVDFSVGGEIAQDFSGSFMTNGGLGSTGSQPAASGGQGLFSAPLCPAGFGGLPRCVECGIAFWRNGSSDAPYFCSSCSNKPALGIYIDSQSSSPDCSYVCPAGYLYPLCRTPLEEVSSVFGGLYGFVSFIAAVILLIFVVLLWLYRRRAAASEALKRSVYETDSSMRHKSSRCCGYGSTGGTNLTHRSSSRLLGNAVEKTYGVVGDDERRLSLSSARQGRASAMAGALSILRRGKRGGCCGFWSYARDKHAVDFLISSTVLQESDLPRHVHRVYFAGCNTFGSSWRLPPILPAHAMRYVRARQYRALCTELNADLAWANWSWERVFHIICSMVFPPAGSYLHRWQRRQRVWHAMTRLLASDESHRWLKGTRVAALQDNIRVGITADFSLAYVDLLRSGTNRATTPQRSRRRTSNVPIPPTPPSTVRLPLALLFAGDGSFECPYYLDPNDVLLRAVPGAAGLSRFIDADWTDFVAEVNIRTRCIVAGATIQTIGPLLAFVEAVNAAARVGEGAEDLLGGLRIDVVRFWPEARTMATRRHNGKVTTTNRNISAAARPASIPPLPQKAHVNDNAAFIEQQKSRSRGSAASDGSSSVSSSGSDSGSVSSVASGKLARHKKLPELPPVTSTSPSQSDRARTMSVSAVMAIGGSNSLDAAGVKKTPSATLLAAAVRAAPSLDGFRRGSRASFSANKNSKDSFSDNGREEGIPDGETCITGGYEDTEIEEDNEQPYSTSLHAQLSSLESLDEDAICIDGARLGLLISLASASISGAGLPSPRFTAAAVATGFPASASAKSVADTRAVVPIVVSTNPRRFDDDFQFGLGEDGVAAVVPGNTRRGGALIAMNRAARIGGGRSSLANSGGTALVDASGVFHAHARTGTAFNLDDDSDLMGPVLSEVSSVRRPLAWQNRASPGSMLVADAAVHDEARPQQRSLDPVNVAVSMAAAGVSSSAAMPHASQDWQRGPVVVSEAQKRKSKSSVSATRGRSASCDNRDAGVDVDDVFENEGSHSLTSCASALMSFIGAFFTAIVGVCSAVLRAFDPARDLDIGGDDDALGTRIDMRLPYAGLPVAAAKNWSWEERARFGGHLLQPSSCCCHFGRRRAQRRQSDAALRYADERSRVQAATPDAFHVAIAGEKFHAPPASRAYVPADSSDVPRVLVVAQKSAAMWLAHARQHRRSHGQYSRRWPGEEQLMTRDSSFAFQQDDGRRASPLIVDSAFDDDHSMSSGHSSSSSASGNEFPSSTASGVLAAQRTRRNRQESFHSQGSSGRRRRATRLRPYAVPSSRSTHWAGGVTCTSLCSSGVRLCAPRAAFVIARVFKRPFLPSYQPSGARSAIWFVCSLVHVVLMLIEVSLALVLFSELWCIEPISSVGDWSLNPANTALNEDLKFESPVVVDVAGQHCNIGPLLTYLLLPPGACLLPPLLGLGAVALQSSRALRLYARWNAVSMWTAGIALALVFNFLPVLGLRILLLPLSLVLVKIAGAQFISVQLSEIERSRPIRGWRGLFEVRTGPVERCANADVKSAR